MSNIFGEMRHPRILIPDNTPLTVLAMIGAEALDWLFAPGAEVWVTDMVREEALRDPDADDDQRERHRSGIAAWFERNKGRIHIQKTDEGEEYRKAMAAWRLVANAHPELKPSWKGRGERRILQVLDGVEKLLAEGEAVVAIVDDRRARAAIMTLTNIDIDLMATESFIHWLASRHHVKEAETAWIAVKLAASGTEPKAPDEDPVHVYKVR